MKVLRPVHKVLQANRVSEGEGLELNRPFPSPGTPYADPFLLLDHFGPFEIGPGKEGGFPPHPHRGFETVTLMLQGRMRHKDSMGNSGLLLPGDAQWMNAGAGVLHAEMPDEVVAAQGGSVEGIQIWINLPASERMSQPTYVDVHDIEMPLVRLPGGTVKVVGGTFHGHRARTRSHVPIGYYLVDLHPGGGIEFEIPSDETGVVYAIHGELATNGEPLSEGQTALFDAGADGLELRSSSGAQAIVLHGKPVGEPIARYGPFVMNTIEDVRQAMEDYRAGLFGKLDSGV